MHKIGVISDTHGLLRPEVLKELKKCELILHGGDVTKREILTRLWQIAPVHTVRGNNDREWARDLQETLRLNLYGYKVFMVHNRKMIPADTDDFDIIIYGHSHKYEEKYIGDQLWLNPGSCGPKRFKQNITMAILEIAENEPFRVQKIDIEHMTAKDAEELPGDIKHIIRNVIKDVDGGRTVAAIAKRNGISAALAEQICRLYLTHPGADEEAILRKMDGNRL